jgi:hypothetical protein
MQIVNFFLNLDPSIYVMVLGGAVGVSLLTQWAKKLFDLTNEKHVEAVINLIALAASGLAYFLSNSHLPPYILGISTITLRGLAQPIYIYVIKPLSTFIANVQAYKSQVLTKVNDISAVADQPIPADVISSVPNYTDATPVTLTPALPNTVITNTPITLATPEQAQAVVDALSTTPADTRPVASF